MFIGPPEEDVEWTDSGLNGVSRFLLRVWRLVLEPSTIVVEGSDADAAVLRRKVAQTVGKVTDHFDELRFNTAVAALMELANAMQDYLQRGGVQDEEWAFSVKTLVKLLNPLAPHLAEEMWAKLGEPGMLADQSWPVFEPGAAAEPKVTLVVQVGGKLRDRLTVDTGLPEEVALEVAMRSEKVRAALNRRGPSKVIYVQDRLINLVP
jgi:leucyl-tRNA synthetase